MSTIAEERRKRILANSELRLAKLRDTDRNGRTSDIPPMAPISTPAPTTLLQKPNSTVANNQPPPLPQEQQSSFFSTITSATNMMNSFQSSSKTKATLEITKEILIVDKQHILVLILGIFVGLLYSFYISSQSNFFFLVYFTTCICILTSRYYSMQMKHRTNILITTAMLSGFQPELMKKLILLYTLICDSWVIFAFYFVTFCSTRAICSLF
jgi:hypothetical protein